MQNKTAFAVPPTVIKCQDQFLFPVTARNKQSAVITLKPLQLLIMIGSPLLLSMLPCFYFSEVLQSTEIRQKKHHSIHIHFILTYTAFKDKILQSLLHICRYNSSVIASQIGN